MALVVVPAVLPPAGLAPLSGHVLAGADRLADADALLCLLTDRVDATLLDRAPRLAVVGTVSVGYDHVDVAALRARGIALVNTPDVLTESTADLALVLMLAALRRVPEGLDLARSGAWRGWAMDELLGHDAYGATLGLVGYGRIARAVERRAAGFGMTVVHHARTSGIPLPDLLRRSDIVSLHVPLTGATRHLIGAAELALMKPTAVLVNTARGPVVDEAALAAALAERRLFAAGLDVYEREPVVHPGLRASPYAVLLPHLGSATVATRLAMTRLAASGVAAVLRGERPPNLVA